ncbi:MAG: hypothetical protein ACRESW_12205, partial [Nevskiales bacterium]
MSESQNQDQKPDQNPDQIPPEAALDPVLELQQQLQTAQAKADETRDLYLRTAAELDNVRK